MEAGKHGSQFSFSTIGKILFSGIEFRWLSGKCLYPLSDVTNSQLQHLRITLFASNPETNNDMGSVLAGHGNEFFPVHSWCLKDLSEVTVWLQSCHSVPRKAVLITFQATYRLTFVPAALLFETAVAVWITSFHIPHRNTEGHNRSF